MKSPLIASAILFLLATQAGAADASFLEDWDLDSDGVITLEELEKFRGKVFQTFDTNQDGVLDSAEYTVFDQARADAAEKNPSALLQRAVNGLSRTSTDLNLDGQVTREEFAQALLAWFRSHDRDNDGVLSPGDF